MTGPWCIFLLHLWNLNSREFCGYIGSMVGTCRCVFSVLGLLIFEVPAAKWRNACAALCLPDTTADVYICVCSVVSNSLRPHGLSPTRLLCPRDSPGKNAGLGCHALLQGIFPT